MREVNEHSDSVFYYLDDLSDTELLQQPTFIESGEKKSKLLGDEEIHSFIKNQQQENTVKKTKYDLNVFQRFLNECGERRQLTEIPADELDSLPCNFYITAKKKDDNNDNNGKINILKDEQFKVSREVLKSKRWELRKH